MGRHPDPERRRELNQFFMKNWFKITKKGADVEELAEQASKTSKYSLHTTRSYIYSLRRSKYSVGFEPTLNDEGDLVFKEITQRRGIEGE